MADIQEGGRRVVRPQEKNYLVFRSVDGTPRKLEFVANIRARYLKKVKSELRKQGLKGKFYVVTRLRKVEVKR